MFCQLPWMIATAAATAPLPILPAAHPLAARPMRAHHQSEANEFRLEINENNTDGGANVKNYR